MINRYTTQEMQELWSEASKFKFWLKVECAALLAMKKNDLVPADVVDRLLTQIENIEIDVERIENIEKETKHDVIAFLTHVAEQVGEGSRYIHLGMTSSDLLDTANALRLTQASDLILSAVKALLNKVLERAEQTKYLHCIGRSHGIHAEPTTIGLKLMGFYAEFSRALERIKHAKSEIATCAISGAVGTYSQLSPKIEEDIAEELGLAIEPHSTQVIPRDRYAAFFAHLGVVASSIERFAVEVRHWQRTEVLEAREGFTKGQKGSSAMPHKRNPILSENLTGLARLVRSAVVPAMENVALWHERDISHSSVERGIMPDATSHLHFAIRRLTGLVENLVFIEDNIQKNLWLTGGLWASQSILLELAKSGLTREDAYVIVQHNAMKYWDDGQPFEQSLLDDPEIEGHLSPEQISDCFKMEKYVRHVDDIFNRVLIRHPPIT